MNSERIRRLLALGSGYPFALGVMVALTAAFVPLRNDLSVATLLSLYLLGVVATTGVVGRNPGLLFALLAPVVANWFLIPPYHTFRINRGENILELVVFVSVAAIVSSFVSIAARRAADAARAEREARALARLAEISQFDPVEQIVELVRETFDFRSARLHLDDGDDDYVVSRSASRDSDEPSTTATGTYQFTGGSLSIVRDSASDTENERLFRSFINQLDKAVEQRRVRALALEAETLNRADELRTAILRSVSHDLRTPLASIKAAVSSLRQDDVTWTAEIEAEFLSSIETETDRLTRLIGNLLDLGRLEAGVLTPIPRSTSIDFVVEAAVSDQPDAGRVDIEIPPDLPDVLIDTALVERAISNLVGNAVKYSPSGRRVTIGARHVSDVVEVSVVDHGPGIPDASKSTVTRPFHRLDDNKQAGGLGLGLAIADRLLAAVGGRLEMRDTPGGGLTTVAVLPIGTLTDEIAP